MSAEAVLSAAAARGVMIACAESCTGGLVSAALTEVPGASAVVERGFVTYTNAAKIEMLGVLPATLEAHGAVSEPVAREMATGAVDQSGASMSIAITGIAGPGGSDHKPEGRVCFGWHFEGQTGTETVEFGALGRSAVRLAACDHALRRLLTLLT